MGVLLSRGEVYHSAMARSCSPNFFDGYQTRMSESTSGKPNKIVADGAVQGNVFCPRMGWGLEQLVEMVVRSETLQHREVSCRYAVFE